MNPDDESVPVNPQELEVSMEAAAVLLSLAMRDTEEPVAGLAGALGRIGASLSELRKRGGTARSPAGSDADMETWRTHLEQDLSLCIESLQFHDRLIQQLAAVRNLLASVTDDDALEVSGFGAQRWEEMLRMLRERLSADSQHQLFNLLMRTGVVDYDSRWSLNAREGSIELF